MTIQGAAERRGSETARHLAVEVRGDRRPPTVRRHAEFSPHRVQQMLQEGALLGQQGDSVQLAAQVSVRGVKDPHERRP